MKVIAHAIHLVAGEYAWSMCGLRSDIHNPLVIDEPVTCLWCIASARLRTWTLDDIICKDDGERLDRKKSHA